MSERIRIVVAEDSLTVRKHLLAILEADPEIEVVGEAPDGKTAIQLVQQKRPDVLSCDLVMPNMSGLAVTEFVMAFCPTPILICSASLNRGEIFRTFDALAAGAVDVVEKPTADSGEWWDESYVLRVKQVARLGAGRVASLRDLKLPESPPAPGPADARLIALACGTGGPSALKRILLALPPDFRIPILVCPHEKLPFGATLAEWLDSQSPLPVGFARDEAPLPEVGQTQVLLAPPMIHVVVHDEKTHYSTAPERNGWRPSADVLFESLARGLGGRVIACVLTGDGVDGADGLLALRRAGAVTIAQQPETCVVDEMPAAAIERGGADMVIPLEELAATLVSLTERVETRGS